MGPQLPLLAILLLSSPFAAHAQLREAAPTPSGNWLALGLGAVGPGFGGLAELTHTGELWTIGVKAEGGGTFTIFGPEEAIEWYALHGGYQFWAPQRSVRLIGGVAYYVHHMDTTSLFGGSRLHVDDGIGLDLEIDGTLAHWKYFGLGATASALISRKYFFGAITLNLLMGILE